MISLSDSLPATPDSAQVGRGAVATLAAAAGATSRQIAEIRLAVSEALTNVIEHAYRDGKPGQVHLDAAVGAGELRVLVADDGAGLRPYNGHSGLGLGLPLIARVSEALMIVTRPSGGTEVRMRFRLGVTADASEAPTLEELSVTRGASTVAPPPAARLVGTAS
jgi:anti-sigma regulatory factor (Ser/Thr protein kinase)